MKVGAASVSLIAGAGEPEDGPGPELVMESQLKRVLLKPM